MQVAFTLEQCWHRVPGGSASSALALAHALHARDDVTVVGVAGRHRRPPQPTFSPDVPMRWLPVGRPLLYDTWNRWSWPKVEAVTGTVDVCHSTVAIPAATAMPAVVTVHDVAFIHHPTMFTKRGYKVMLAGLRRCRDADVVCCPSDTTRTELLNLEIGIDPDRVRVVPWGVDQVGVDPEHLRSVQQRYSLPESFVLFVGTVEPRKNLARLQAAMADVDLPLIVAGAPGWGPDRTADAAGDVTFLGFVPADDLAALYASATVFAYPSVAEGFGMPVLEAMSQGVPVVTSRGTATEEAADGAAVLVDPGEVASIRDGVLEALGRSGELAAAGRQRAARATWADTAQLTVDAYREAIAVRGARP